MTETEVYKSLAEINGENYKKAFNYALVLEKALKTACKEIDCVSCCKDRNDGCGGLPKSERRDCFFRKLISQATVGTEQVN